MDQHKRDRYARLRDQIGKLIASTDAPVARRATAAALIHHKVPGVSWTGFYLLRGSDLIVDAYQGPVACIRLANHQGVCWAAIDQKRSLVVPDVHAFPGHIACDSRSQSEVVVPLRDEHGAIVGVLDVDSHKPAHFDEVDQEGLEGIVRVLEKR